MDKKEIKGFPHIAYKPKTYENEEATSRAKAFYQWLNLRRTVREISDRPVSREIIENFVLAASTAPSGGHKQPWTFCIISNSTLKSEVRKAAEKEEKENYNRRMSKRWLQDLAPFGTDWNKPFLENAPWIIVVFKRVYEYSEDNKVNNYYVNESVGIACGMLIASIHNAGLVTLPHTPSPMNFLARILERPENERPFLLLPIGYPQENVFVPDLKRKSLKEIAVFYD